MRLSFKSKEAMKSQMIEDAQADHRPAGLPDFLSGDGEMGERIRAFDWSKTPLGPIDSWPQSLKTATAILLRSPVPIVMLWGEDGIMIYNDAYSVFAGGRHPQLLGSKVREGWPEVADFNDNVMKVGLAGGTLAYRDQELTLYRSGRPEQVWMNLDYSPVLDESGRPAGVIAIVVETTEKVLAERRNVAERERLKQMFEQAPGLMAMLRGPNHVFELANPAYMQLIGDREIIGKPVREALPEIEGQGFLKLLDDVYRSGTAFVGSGMDVVLQRTLSGQSEERSVDFVFQPITDSEGKVTGIFVEGTDVTERKRGEALLAAQKRALELTVADAPLAEVLETLVRTAEEQSGAGMIGSILLLEEDGLHLRHGAAPNLPDAYNEAIDGIEIGPHVGSCGTAAHSGQPVYVVDIAADPLWADFRDLALSHGLRACWSTPIRSGRGEILGTFAMYYRQPQHPTAADLELVDVVTRTVGLVLERKRAEEHLRLLIAELNHRVKNTLATVQSIAAQTFRGNAAEPQARAAFEERLLALSEVHTLLTRENWEGAGLREIAAQALEPYKSRHGDSDRFAIDGHNIRLRPKTALALAMAFHELASNAAKYGALSSETGRVTVDWARAGDRLCIVWRENGGPPVAPPSRRGFGSRLIERGLAHELNGTVRLDYRPEGVVCTIDIPAPTEGERE